MGQLWSIECFQHRRSNLDELPSRDAVPRLAWSTRTTDPKTLELFRVCQTGGMRSANHDKIGRRDSHKAHDVHNAQARDERKRCEAWQYKPSLVTQHGCTRRGAAQLGLTGTSVLVPPLIIYRRSFMQLRSCVGRWRIHDPYSR